MNARPSPAVMLNSFQHPCAVICATSDAHGSSGRAAILKQVQDDDLIEATA